MDLRGLNRTGRSTWRSERVEQKGQLAVKNLAIKLFGSLFCTEAISLNTLVWSQIVYIIWVYIYILDRLYSFHLFIYFIISIFLLVNILVKTLATPLTYRSLHFYSTLGLNLTVRSRSLSILKRIKFTVGIQEKLQIFLLLPIPLSWAGWRSMQKTLRNELWYTSARVRLGSGTKLDELQNHLKICLVFNCIFF